jgi:hypothetical protein
MSAVFLAGARVAYADLRVIGGKQTYGKGIVLGRIYRMPHILDSERHTVNIFRESHRFAFIQDIVYPFFEAIAGDDFVGDHHVALPGLCVQFHEIAHPILIGEGWHHGFIFPAGILDAYEKVLEHYVQLVLAGCCQQASCQKAKSYN